MILLTARIWFVVSRKDEFSMRPPPCCRRNEGESGCEKQLQWLQRQRALSEMYMCRRLGISPALGRWGDTTSLSPSSYLGCLGSLRRENGSAAVRSQERQDGTES